MKHSKPRRPVRVAARIQQVLMETLLQSRMRNPLAQGVLVTHVDLSPDFKQAKVYLRSEMPDADQHADRVVQAMQRSAGFLRTELAKRTQLKRMPALHFQWDYHTDEVTRLETLLDQERAVLDAQNSDARSGEHADTDDEPPRG